VTQLSFSIEWWRLRERVAGVLRKGKKAAGAFTDCSRSHQTVCWCCREGCQPASQRAVCDGLTLWLKMAKLRLLIPRHERPYPLHVAYRAYLCALYTTTLRDCQRAGRSVDRIPVGARFSAPVQTGPGANPASCTMGTGSFTGVKSGRGVTLTPHPLLVPWS
jgi:hypothetical protein